MQKQNDWWSVLISKHFIIQATDSEMILVGTGISNQKKCVHSTTVTIINNNQRTIKTIRQEIASVMMDVVAVPIIYY
jgi:hypothetical protein